MRGRTHGVAVGLVLAAAVAPAAWADAPRQAASLKYTTTTPSAATGSVLSIDWVNPNDPNAKPYAIKTLIVQFAPGSTLDTSVPEQCKASDAQLEAEGAAACPPASQVASGTIVTDSGGNAGPFPRFIDVAATNFNNQGEVIGIGDATNAPIVPGVTRTVTRSQVTGNSFSTDFPAFRTGSPPDGFNALKSLRVTAAAIARDGRAYGRTPATCPASGSWTNKLTFVYQDGVTQTVLSDSPCTSPRPVRIRVHLVPRHRCAERRVGLRTRISSSGALRSVAFSLDGRRIRVSRRRVTRLHLPMARLRPGRHVIEIAARDASGRAATRQIAFWRCG
jgi:hypothetical protein